MAELPPGLLISAPRSGAGKTTVTLGLLRAFRDRGAAVQPFKAGPDYIDPAFHGVAAGRASCNLDTWAMSEAAIAGLINGAEDADLIIAEGAMGLFDCVTAPGECGTGASADLAALTGWPVVLVSDVSGQAQSAAAVALGFAAFRSDLKVAGVILNRVASPRHEAMVRAGFEAAGIAVFGALPRDSSITLPERHLGLVQAGEHADLDMRIAALAKLIHTHVDLGALRAAAASRPLQAQHAPRLRPPGQRIALAQDAAFSFTYPHLVAGWRAAGAEILPFSPLADEPPDDGADMAWLPGGYPELHAERLAAANTFRAGLAHFAATRPVHGECGGYMALGEALIDKDGVRHRMAGLLGLVTSYEQRKMHLGYRLARISKNPFLLGENTRIRGHEFHYSIIVDQPDAPLARVTDAYDAEVPETGSWRGNVSGTFFHMIGEAT